LLQAGGAPKVHEELHV